MVKGEEERRKRWRRTKTKGKGKNKEKEKGVERIKKEKDKIAKGEDKTG